MGEMKIHSDEAWEIASCYSYTLASDTRTLAAQIDRLIDKVAKEATEKERERCLKLVVGWREIDWPVEDFDRFTAQTVSDNMSYRIGREPL